MVDQRVADLLYDSATAGSGLNSRSALSVDRLVLFYAPPFQIEVLVRAGESGFRAYHGQVMDDIRNVPVPRAQVSMRGDGSAAVTDEFGQFALSGNLTNAQEILTVNTGSEAIECTIPLVAGR